MPTLHVHILLGLSDTHRRSLMPFHSAYQVRLRIRATLVGLVTLAVPTCHPLLASVTCTGTRLNRLRQSQGVHGS